MFTKTIKIFFLISCISTSNILFSQIQKSILDSTLTKNNFDLKVENTVINNSLWMQPYRFENDSLKSLTVKLTIEKKLSGTESFDPNLIYILDDIHNLRIRPNAIFYYKADKRVYYKSKPVNQNYNNFKEKKINGYDNFEAKTFKTNFLGFKKKKIKASIQQLKKINIKVKKITYFIDFPVKKGFNYGKVFYKDRPIGFAVIATN